MKKHKIFCLLLTVAFSLMLFGGSVLFAGQAPKAEKAEKVEKVEKVEKAEGPYLFGVSIWSDSGPLSKKVISNLRYAAGVLGAEVEVAVDGFKPDNQVSNIENLIARGCDAVMICNCTDAVVPKIVKLTDEAGVPLALYFRKINDPEIKKYAESSPYFIGNVHEDEVAVGYNLGSALADKGCRNAVIINYNKGDTTAENRYKGYKKAFAEKGIALLGEQWDVLDAEPAANAVESFIAAFPELDAIAVGGGGGGPLSGTIRAVKNHNKIGRIRITASDFGPDIAESLKNKEVAAMSGGHWTDPFFTFMLLYNYVDGTPLSKKVETITMQPIYLTSVSEAQEYIKWCMDQPPYNDEEIKNMTVRHNSSFTLSDLRKIAAAYSLQDVIKRHK
jgi:ribose transport system substrate-binding protein